MKSVFLAKQAKPARLNPRKEVSVEASLETEKSISSTSLSTRAKRALEMNNVHTVNELRLLLEKRGADYLRSRMFGIGRVTAEELLRFLETEH